jgi:hypothetical protein
MGVAMAACADGVSGLLRHRARPLVGEGTTPPALSDRNAADGAAQSVGRSAFGKVFRETCGLCLGLT